MLSVALFSVLATFVSAATPIDIAGLEAHFANAGLDTLFPVFKPQGILTGTFGSSSIKTGALVPQDTAGTAPTLIVDSVEGFDASAASGYTALLVDANIVGTDESGKAQNLHWLANNVQVGAGGSDGSHPVVTEGATQIRSYAGPGPAEGSGSHRYVFLLYAQPADFAAPAGYDAPIESVDPFDLNTYVKDANLELVAANYFNVENGVATVTVSQTEAVDSATLVAASATAASASGAASASASGAASGAASGSAGASTAADSKSSTGAEKPSTSAPSASATPASGASKLAPAFALGALVAGTIFPMF